MKKTLVLILSLILAFSTTVMAYEEAHSSEQLALSTTHSIVFDDEVSEFGYQGYKFVDENGNEIEPQYDDIMFFAALPSSYRNTNLTPVKDQKEAGCCWAFAMIGAMEANLIKQGYNADKLDFSEAHMAYFSRNIRDSIHNDGPESDGVQAYMLGGNEYLALAAMAKGSGAVSESVMPYDEYTENIGTSGIYDAKTVDESKRFLTEAGIKVFKSINPENQTAIKSAIMGYGSVINTYYADTKTTDHYSSQTFAYHYPPSSEVSANHATLIVGWDDNFPKENFKDGNQPENDGAWIVRNSWGEEFGEDGYFYLSYESTLYSTSAVVAAFEKYDNNYGYTGGMIYSYYRGFTVTANMFTADSDEVLEAISFNTTGPQDARISIYKNATMGKTPVYGGTCVFSGTFGMTGDYHRVVLPEGIPISEGETYSIIIDGPTVCVEPDSTTEESYTNNIYTGWLYDGTWWYCSANGVSDVSIRAHTNENKPKINTQVRNNTIEVESKYNDTAAIYIAQYDGDELIDIKIATEAALNTNATKYRIFSWDTDMTSTTGYFVEDEI